MYIQFDEKEHGFLNEGIKESLIIELISNCNSEFFKNAEFLKGIFKKYPLNIQYIYKHLLVSLLLLVK